MAWDTGMAGVIGAAEGESFWLREPLGAFVDVKLAPPENPSNLYSAGTQKFPGGAVGTAITMTASEKLLYVLAGEGTVEIEGRTHPLQPGSTVYVGRFLEHGITSTSSDDLVVFFVLWPPTADTDALGPLGSPRRRGEAPPDQRPSERSSNRAATQPPTSGRGPSVVLGPDDGASYWQPAPTDGYATIKLSPANLASNHVTVVEQVVPPGKLLPPHGHPRNEELKIIRTGTGVATVAGTEYPVGPGDLCVTGRWVEHSFSNTGDDDLTIFAVFMPPSLEILLSGIGRPRTVGDPPPESFGLPETVFQLAVEANLVIPEQIAAHDAGGSVETPTDLPTGLTLDVDRDAR